MSSLENGSTGKKYWRSLEELADTPEFRESLAKEFPSLLPEVLSPATRRRFLKLMGASMAMAGVAGCSTNNPTWPRWKEAKILPRAFRPHGHMPGTPLHYATSFEIGGVARALLAKSYDGRPIKIEGNPDHPASQGAADALSQAMVLGLYDPDRSTAPARNSDGHESDTTWEAFRSEFAAAVDGGGVAVLAEASSSPTLRALRTELAKKLPGLRWVEWESISRDQAREGARLAFGRPLRAQYDLRHAEVIVSLEEDLLMTHPDAIAQSKAWVLGRRATGDRMSRLHVVESAYSVTGGQADQRIPLPSGQVGPFLWALAARLFGREKVTLPAAAAFLRPLLQQADTLQNSYPAVVSVARDLADHRGHGLIAVGPSQPPAVHALAHVLNAALGNLGKTVSMADDVDPDRPTHLAALSQLVDAMKGGQVRTLLVLGGNPAYDAPADFGFAAALRKVPMTAHLSLYRDETSALCGWHLPRAHALEAWGDALSWDGTWTLAQPLIEPLYGGKSPAELLAFLLGEEADGEALVKSTFEKAWSGRSWRSSVHDGFVAGTAKRLQVPKLSASSWAAAAGDLAAPHTTDGVTEVTFQPDLKLWDGRFANNGWLQELPDPMTKLTWDNAALINPLTAQSMGLRQGDLLRLRVGEVSLTMPALLMPGQAIGSIALAVGYGRTRAGRLAERDSSGEGGGFYVGSLRTSAGWHMLPAVQLESAGGHYDLCLTQEHHALTNESQGKGQAQRLPEIFREASLGEYLEHPDFAKHRTHHPPLLSLWEERDWTQSDHRWGMAIDLTACTGCGSCVVACQAENNTPVVGKEEVGVGREMHWIRVDRYFSGDLENPQVAHQPVACHHCENAPCEQVCPVAATTHSDEGLNDMVYNRCVGTRYCSNNCPYKVRRFNYFNNQENLPEIFKMHHNPDVTVRARGVMEKCTYCVQRIKAKTIPADNEKRALADGEIVPACAQTCPTSAIVFGDLGDPQSEVRRQQEHPRSYALLSELNVKPRTQFLAKLRNPVGGSGHGAPHGQQPDAHNGHDEGENG